MKKRALSLLLALVMAIGLLPVTARAGQLSNGLEYEVYDNHWTEIGAGSHCGQITRAPYDPNHTHEYDAVVTAPTCTEQGFTTYICTICGESYVDAYVDALGHDLFRFVVEPTCTGDGYYIINCTRCDYSEKHITEATGHSYTAVVTAPTCTARGYTTYTCTVCGDSYRDDYTLFLGHNYRSGICTRCGEVDSDYQKPVVNPFNDVPECSFYYKSVLWAVENGITSGTSRTTFSPVDSCLRAHVVTFLWRAAGSPAPKSVNNPFVDVKPSAFYYDAVLWAVEKGITSGTDATHFNPNGVCNRVQVVSFLHRAFGAPIMNGVSNPFTDVPSDAWYTTAVLWAVENGITNGVDATHFGPTTACNRAQVVTFLYRAYN